MKQEIFIEKLFEFPYALRYYDKRIMAAGDLAYNDFDGELLRIKRIGFSLGKLGYFCIRENNIHGFIYFFGFTQVSPYVFKSNITGLY